MKKNLFYVGALFLGLILGTSCSEEDGLVKNKQTLVEATINNPASRTTVSSEYKVVWSQGDAYTVWSSEGTQKGDLTLATGEGTTTGFFKGTLNSELANGDVALFPSVSGESKSYTFNSGYTTTETDTPMLGTYNGTSFSFNHLAAFIRVNANDLPAGDAVLTIESTNQALAGVATLTAENALIPTEGKTVTVTFKAKEGDDLVFDAPIPAQAYDKITLTLTVGGTEIFQKERALNAVVGNLYELTSTNQTAINEANTVLQGLQENESLNVNISGLANNAPINVPFAEGSILNMNFSDVTAGESIIINNNAEGSVGESQQNIGFNVANDESTAINMTINTPTATVEVGNGYFTTVTATTATNTLIVKSGVNIGTLTINGGNVVIESGATVGSITNNVSGNTITAQVISLEELNAAIGKGYNVILGADITASDIIVIDKAITLDGNGHTLTSTAGRAINVSGADGVTIKNLTIKASGERAINIIQNATNVTIDNVTATAANYTVNVAGSAPNAKVDIKNSTLNGLCTVNVAAAGANVKVDNSTINCNDNNTTMGEDYAALSLNKEAVGGKITATNTTINVVEGSDSFKGRNDAENGEVTIDGSTADVVVMVACITYPGSDNYHAFATLAKAVEFAKEGDVINLLRDITLEEGLIISKDQNLTIDLNGHTINAGLKEEGRHHYAIDNYGTLVVEGTGAINARGIENFGTMTINGDIIITNIDTNGGAAIWNEGTLTINKGTFTTNTTAGAGSYGAALNTRSGGVAVVNGGNFSAYSQLTYAIINEGTTTINNAVVKGKHGAVSGSGGTTFIKDGSFELMENPGISDHCTYMVSEITGGKFTLGNNTDSGAQLFYSSIVAEGYKTIVENGWTKVVKE